jgi:hypothetical protein
MMTPELRSELSAALRNNQGQLGKVFALIEDGMKTNRELVEGGAAANQGAAGNLRVTIQLILDGLMPRAPSVAAQSRRSIGGIIRDNPELSVDALTYLDGLRSALEAIETDSTAIEVEDRDLERGSRVLEKSLDAMPGVYVFTLPSFFRTVQKTDPERFWFKVGKTDRLAGVRIGEIMRATGLPEDPFLVRVYQHPNRGPREIESQFHRLLDAAGHSRSGAHHAGREWYATNLEFLDAVALALGCEIAAAEHEIRE